MTGVVNCRERVLAAMRIAPRTLVSAALVFALLTGTAFAQLPMPGISLGHTEKRKLTPEEQAKQDQLDAAYKAATKKIPDKQVNDPWADVRSGPSGSSSGTAADHKSASAQKKKQQQPQPQPQ